MTPEEKRKLYAALAAPFPEHCIQRTEGRVTGRGYDTTGIGYQHVVNRLNEVLGVGGWRAHRTVTVKEITRGNGRQAFEAVCDITMELGEWVDGNFVVFAESLADGGHVASLESDARKGSFTNALKKAAAMFGCGRQAYEGSLDDDHLPPEPPGGVSVSTLPTQSTQRPSPPAPLPAAAPRASNAPRNRLSSKQLAAIWALGRKLGYEQQALRQFVKGKFGAQPEFLTREQASSLIGAMSEQAGNGHAQEQHEPGAEG